MPLTRPCIQPGCSAATLQGRCPLHRRDPNLARDRLDRIARRDGYRCHFCRGNVDMGLRGIFTKDAPSLHHLKGTADTDDNLTLSHIGCNASAG